MPKEKWHGNTLLAWVSITWQHQSLMQHLWVNLHLQVKQKIVFLCVWSLTEQLLRSPLFSLFKNNTNDHTSFLPLLSKGLSVHSLREPSSMSSSCHHWSSCFLIDCPSFFFFAMRHCHLILQPTCFLSCLVTFSFVFFQFLLTCCKRKGTILIFSLHLHLLHFRESEGKGKMCDTLACWIVNKGGFDKQLNDHFSNALDWQFSFKL